MTMHLPGRDPLRSVTIGFTLILLTFLGGVWQRATGVFTPLDHAVQQGVALVQFTWLTPIMVFLTRCGQEGALTLIAGLLYWGGHRYACALLLLLLLIAGTGANDHMKNWFEQERPTAEETAQLDPASSGGYGYPSGHTLTGVLLAWTVYYVVGGRALLACALLAPLMALTRIYLGVHYFSDTVGGALHGLGWLYLASAGVHVLGLLPADALDDRAIRRAFAGGGAVAALLYVFMNPAHASAVRFGALLLGTGLGAACVPQQWRPRSPAHFIGMGVLGLVLVGGVRVGLGAVLPDVDVAHSVRYALMGLVLGGSPLLFARLGLAQYRNAGNAVGPEPIP